MPAKKATAVKKVAVKKVAVKKAPAKRAVKGDGYECVICGLSVVIDEECGCADIHEIICCGEPMKAKKPRAKVAAKK